MFAMSALRLSRLRRHPFVDMALRRVLRQGRRRRRERGSRRGEEEAAAVEFGQALLAAM